MNSESKQQINPLRQAYDRIMELEGEIVRVRRGHYGGARIVLRRLLRARERFRALAQPNRFA